MDPEQESIYLYGCLHMNGVPENRRGDPGGNCGYGRKSVKESIRPDGTPNYFLPAGIGLNNIDSFWLDPGIGATFYDGADWNSARKASATTWKGEVNDFLAPGWWRDTIDFVLVQKDCSNRRWMWDNNCLNGPEFATLSNCIGDNYAGSACRRFQKEECARDDMDFDANQNCRSKFCMKEVNATDCTGPVRSFCQRKLVSGRSIKNDDLCTSHLDHVYRQVCNADKMNLADCQNYCSRDDKWEQCKSDVFRYCKGNTLKTDVWCQEAMANRKAHGDNKVYMQQFCNGDGADMPLCSCLNIAKVKKEVEAIKDVEPNVVSSLISRPECFYQACSMGASYRIIQDPPGCQPIQVCKNVIGVVNIIGNKAMIKQDNNCNQTTNQGGGNTQPAGKGTSPTAKGTSPVAQTKKSWVLLGLGAGTVTLFMVFSCICCCCLLLFMTKRRR